jgi:hypothetical protein
MSMDCVVTRINIDMLVDGSIFTVQKVEIAYSYSFRLYTIKQTEMNKKSM